MYDGEEVVARLGDGGDLTLTGPGGSVRATGSASMAPQPALERIEAAAVPDEVPPATADRLTPGTTLGTLAFHFRQEHAAQYLADVRETSSVYEGGAIAHPGFLARQANYVLSNSVRLGPWIHVSTRACHRGLVRDGDDMEVRGVVVDEREHKGHRFVDLNVEITARSMPVWSAFHTAIWQPRRSRNDQVGSTR